MKKSEIQPCDGDAACRETPRMVCGCSRCDREPDDGKYATCATHVNAVRERHVLVYRREPVWYLGGAK